MYQLSVELQFAAAHHLREYQGKCSRVHGHNYRVEVRITGTQLDEHGMLIDFGRLKDICQEVIGELDHTDLNEHPFFQQDNPTSENLARYIFGQIANRFSDSGAVLEAVRVWESDTASATYTEG